MPHTWSAHHARCNADRLAAANLATGGWQTYGQMHDRLGRIAALRGSKGSTAGDRGRSFIHEQQRHAGHHDGDLAALHDHCAGYLAEYKHPQFLKLVDALPCTATAKVQKFALRQARKTKMAD